MQPIYLPTKDYDEILKYIRNKIILNFLNN